MAALGSGFLLTEERLLLHICCAPDATVPWSELQNEGWFTVGFFYGSNIHPEEEFLKRAEAVKALSLILAMKAVIQTYDPQSWHDVTAKFADEPECGKRCAVCFALQLKAAAEYARDNGFTHLSTTLTISPHKDPVLINRLGREASEQHGLVWIERVWRKNDGFKRSVSESRRLGLYRQNYCGCIYSERTSNYGTEK